MKNDEKLMIKSDIVDGYIPKDCCTIDRYGGADDELCCSEICENTSCNNCCIQKVFNRLAEYEETGLSPDEVKSLVKPEVST